MKKQKLNNHHNNSHRPVLLAESVRLLGPKPGDSYLDLTAGYGGHAAAVLDQTKSPDAMVLVDRDSQAIEHLRNFRRMGAEVIQGDFLSTTRRLRGEGRSFQLILADLGVSSPHFDRAERGFSFSRPGPLDMRMDLRQKLRAEHIVNGWSQDELVRILAEYGEEPQAVKIAKAIIAARPLKTTAELSETVAGAVKRRGKRHPATKTFQALRIAVNDELNQLARTLPIAIDLLASGGRIAVISFHSLEDRLVKQFFKEESSSGYESRLKLLTKKPILGTEEEVHNPRARSAKLRAAVKINKQKEGGA